VSKKLLVSLIIVITFHVVGIIGMTGDQPSFFVNSTPFNLLLSAFLLFLNHHQWTVRQAMLLVIIFCLGFLAEVIGTNTGYLFGNYQYGKTLGFKVFNVPVVIGVNWAMQVYIAGNLVMQLGKNPYIRAFAGSILLVLLDYFIEPVAVEFDYWQWENNVIPLTNYACWFFISFVFLSLFFKSGFRQYNPLSGVLYVIQLLMFIILGSQV